MIVVYHQPTNCSRLSYLHVVQLLFLVVHHILHNIYMFRNGVHNKSGREYLEDVMNLHVNMQWSDVSHWLTSRLKFYSVETHHHDLLMYIQQLP